MPNCWFPTDKPEHFMYWMAYIFDVFFIVFIYFSVCIWIIKCEFWWIKPQAQPIDPDLTAKLLGRGVAVSPIVTVEPRRRKFHKAITLSMPAPKAHSQGMINQYSGNAPTLRLLCSITGKPIFNWFFLVKVYEVSQTQSHISI